MTPRISVFTLARQDTILREFGDTIEDRSQIGARQSRKIIVVNYETLTARR